jgi:hypothetical protein
MADESQTRAVATTTEPQLPALRTIRPGTPVAAFVPQDFEQAVRIARAIAASGMAPKSYNNDEMKILVGMMTGAEVGLTPMQSLRGVAVIGNQPSIWGDVALALVQGSGLLEDINESTTGTFLDPNNANGEAVCTVKRRGKPTPTVRTYSMNRARKAGLLTKQGAWQIDPERMCQMRARLYALRDTFADVLAGLNIADRDEHDEETDVQRATREAVETRRASIEDLGAQARGEVHTEATAEPTREPEPKPEPEPQPKRRVRTPRRQTEQEQHQDVVDEQANPPAPTADAEQREHTRQIDEIAEAEQPEDAAFKEVVTSLERAAMKQLQDTLDGLVAAGDHETAQLVQRDIDNMRKRYDFGDEDEPGGIYHQGGYDLNRDQTAAPDANALERAMDDIRKIELIADIQKYVPNGLNSEQLLEFESRRARIVATKREEARTRR